MVDKPIIYLATPYTHEDKAVEQARFERVTLVSALLIKEGIINFSPITQSHEQNRMLGLPGTWEFWKTIDTEFLKRCDALYVLAEPGWQKSTGVTAEIDIMRDLQKPTFYIKYEDDKVKLISELEARRIA